MANPLSIAASVTGLLTVTEKIAVTISGFLPIISDSHRSVIATLGAVRKARMILDSIRLVMDDLPGFAERRKRMIDVKHLVIIFRELILSLSELEAIVISAISFDGKGSKLDQLEWLLKQKRPSHPVRRLESYTIYLSSTLSILQCESDFEAQKCLIALHGEIQNVMAQNYAILRQFETYYFYAGVDDTSIRTFDDAESVLRTQRASDEDSRSSARWLSLPILEGFNAEIDALSTAFSLRDFELAMEEMHVYQPLQSSDMDFTSTSSAIRTNTRSMLPELSLNDTSMISVIALPISLEEINSIGPNLTFANMMSWTGTVEPAHTDPGRLSQVPNESLSIRKRPSPWNISGLAGRRFLQSNGRLVGKLLPVQRPLRDPNIRAGSNAGDKMILYKLLVLGDSSKTALCIQFCLNRFVEAYDPTIEDSFRKQARIDGKLCMLDVLDTSGQEEYTALRDEGIRTTDGIVLSYSITDRLSFVQADRIHQQVLAVKIEQELIFPGQAQSHLPAFDGCAGPIMLVGNNCDQASEREVSTQEGAALARKLGCQFIEASAKRCINVEKAFYDVVRMIRQQQP